MSNHNNHMGREVKTLTADDNYSLPNSENLLQPIQIQLSKNVKTFAQHFAIFLGSVSNFKHFEKKDGPGSLCNFNTTDCERHG